MLIDPFRFPAPAAEVVFCGYQREIPFAATVTVSDIAIGDESDDRVVFLGIFKAEAPEYQSLVSGSIGGVSATIHAATENVDDGADVYWISAPVPTGTTATVILVFSGEATGGGLVYVSSFAAYKLQSSAAVDAIAEDTDSATGPTTYDIDVKCGGIVLFAMWVITIEDSDDLALSGVAENFKDKIVSGSPAFPKNQFFMGGCALTDDDQTGYGITFTQSDPNDFHDDIAAAVSFR